jgi:hypothetical protein
MDDSIFLKYKICVSGAADTSRCGEEASRLAEELGKVIAQSDVILIDGATTGFPFWTAKGAKIEGGLVVGVSPASSKLEHIQRYKLPLDYHDVVMYTGHGYSGRNLLLTRMADAVIVGCGRMGTLNEFTIAFEDKKPIGILEGPWDTDELFEFVLKDTHRLEEMEGKIARSPDPETLVKKILEIIKNEEAKNGSK